MENPSLQPSTNSFAVQLNGELRQVIESLRLFKEFLPLKHGTSEELRELIHDKHLTALLQVKQKTIQTSLKGLSDCFEALSTAVKKGKLDKVNDAMRIADENLSNLTSVMIGVQYHLLKEYNNVKANKRRQGWNLLFTIVVGAGMGWVKLAFSSNNSENDDKGSQVFTKTTSSATLSSTLSNGKTPPTPSSAAPFVEQLSNIAQSNSMTVSKEPGSGSLPDMNGFSYTAPLYGRSDMITVSTKLSTPDTLISMAPLVEQLPTITQSNSKKVSIEPGSGPLFDMNGFLYDLLLSRWTTVGILACIAIYSHHAFSSYLSLHERTLLLRRHELEATRIIDGFKSCGYLGQENDDKGKLEALTRRNLHPSYLFDAEDRQIVMRDCADIKIIIQSIHGIIQSIYG